MGLFTDMYPNVSRMYPVCILIFPSVSHQDTSRYIEIQQDTFVSGTSIYLPGSEYSIYLPGSEYPGSEYSVLRPGAAEPDGVFGGERLFDLQGSLWG